MVNWTDEVDQTPPTPTQDITILGLESLYCLDPDRAGDEEVFVGSGSYGTGPGAQSVSTSTCVPDVGATFTSSPRRANRSTSSRRCAVARASRSIPGRSRWCTRRVVRAPRHSMSRLADPPS